MDGLRTRGLRIDNPLLYLLSYHLVIWVAGRARWVRIKIARVARRAALGGRGDLGDQGRGDS